ncbi:MAG TPA: hypothetical protein VLA87_00465 [Gaiellaceae bacterium]|nr:hypothetical protein [Gaiellaceae bacterium]
MPEKKPRKESESKQRRRGKSGPRASWRQHAGFSLFFDRSESRAQDWQTRIYHDESDEEVVLPGADLEACLSWIAQRAGLSAEAGTAVTGPEPVPAEGEPTEVEIAVSELTLSEYAPETSFEKSLAAELRFQLSGDKAGDLAERHSAFRVETYAVDLESGDPKLVASEEGELRDEVFEYATEQVFPVPELGRYELHGVVVLLPPEEAMAARRGPVIEVVP